MSNDKSYLFLEKYPVPFTSKTGTLKYTKENIIRAESQYKRFMAEFDEFMRLFDVKPSSEAPRTLSFYIRGSSLPLFAFHTQLGAVVGFPFKKIERLMPQPSKFHLNDAELIMKDISGRISPTFECINAWLGELYKSAEAIAIYTGGNPDDIFCWIVGYISDTKLKTHVYQQSALFEWASLIKNHNAAVVGLSKEFNPNHAAGEISMSVELAESLANLPKDWIHAVVR